VGEENELIIASAACPRANEEKGGKYILVRLGVFIRILLSMWLHELLRVMKLDPFTTVFLLLGMMMMAAALWIYYCGERPRRLTQKH
jgi:hypothetical protein